MMKAEQITLIYNKFCPYAHRALIIAIQKELTILFKKTSLGQGKTAFFTQLYSKALGKDQTSKGKVPILIHNTRIITESQIICWYLAEQFNSGSSLIPKDTYNRAKMRVWINQTNAWIISIIDRAKFKRVQSLQDFSYEVSRFLSKVNQSIEGDYFLKDGISLADLMIYPWFQRWIILEHYFGIRIQEKYSKVLAWLKNMNSRKSITQIKKLTGNDNQYYIDCVNKISAKL